METDNVPVQYMLVPEEDRVKVEKTKQILVIEDDVVDLWHTVGATQGLSTDVDICRFLLSLYVSRGPGAPQYSSRCSHCNAILTPICINCNLPSRPSSQQTPPAQQAQSSQGSRHLTQQDPFQESSAPSAASARPASPEDSGGWHLPENDDDDSDGAGGLDMEVYGDDAGDVSAVEMERPRGKGPKQGKKQVLAKVSYPKIPSKMLKKRKGSRVAVAAKRKSTRVSPASNKTSTKTCDSSGRVGEGKDTDHTCTKCDSKFMSKRALSSHMNRSSCKPAPLQSTADAQASATASDPSQQDSSHPEAETSKEKESTQEQNGGDKAAEKEENSMEISAVTVDSFPVDASEVVEETHPFHDVPDQAQAMCLPILTSKPRKSQNPQRHLCQECGHSFQRSKALTEHRRQKHAFESGPRYRCTLCEKTYMNVTEYHSHVSAHAGVKPHQCAKCNRSYQDRRNLTRHVCKKAPILIHACSICDGTFPSARLFRQHMHTHDKNPQFQCPLCRSYFKQRQSLLRHQNKSCPMASKQ
ncbi:zinc finger and BTB domain-containing protein 11-like isoform X5 [Littorina saxatilis]|uniref:zinc finger and BTB domain-containing protein 11-like isoform X5 n=1 Tax=Littorina saxatilis TaxID=31220 RepID=UPI0038B63ACE